MWLYRTILLSSLLLITFVDYAHSKASADLETYQLTSTFTDDTGKEENNKPRHRGSGR